MKSLEPANFVEMVPLAVISIDVSFPPSKTIVTSESSTLIDDLLKSP